GGGLSRIFIFWRNFFVFNPSYYPSRYVPRLFFFKTHLVAALVHLRPVPVKIIRILSRKFFANVWIDFLLKIDHSIFKSYFYIIIYFNTITYITIYINIYSCFSFLFVNGR